MVYERCCGLDVHKKTVVACVLVTSADGVVQRTVRTFATMTADLLALDDWLCTQEIVQVAMESSGVYWQPVYNILEEGRTILLVNPQRVLCCPWTQDRRERRSHGSLTCCVMASCSPVSSHLSPSATCANSPAIARR